MKNLSLSVLFILLVNFTNAQIINEFDINFESASFQLSLSDEAKLNLEIVPIENDYNFYRIQIIGHTDNVGNMEFNRILSKKRALTIADFLINKGFSKDRIHTSGKAFLEPISNNNSDEGKYKNRRVHVVISKISDKIKDIGGITLKENYYKINTAKKQTIQYKSGTKIYIPENAFVDKNGTPIKGTVDLSYIEYRNPVDFALSNISMNISENEFFNSSGMFKILASKNGEEVFLDKNKKIDFDFKITQNIPNLNFYEYNSATKKWTELSKINPSFGSEGDDVNDTNYKDICSMDVCESFYFLKRKGTQYALSQESLVKNYRLDLAKDSLIDSNFMAIRNKDSLKLIRKRDSLFELKNKIKFARINLKINNFRNRINKNNFQIEDFNNKIIELTSNIADTISNKDSRKINHFENMNAALTNKNAIFQNKINDLIESKGKGEPIPAFPKLQKSHQFDSYYNCFWEINKKYMSSEEKGMNILSWLSFFDSNKAEMVKRYADIDESKKCIEIQKERENQKKIADENYKKMMLQKFKIDEVYNNANKLTKSLSISNLGIYNCDQIARLNQPIVINAKYIDENGNKIQPFFIYLVDNKFNGIIQYVANARYSPNYFAFSRSSKNTLFAFDDDGECYVLSSEKFKDINVETMNTLTVKKIDKLNDYEELKSLF